MTMTEWRERRKLTQTQAAKRVDVPASVWCRWEKWEAGEPGGRSPDLISIDKILRGTRGGVRLKDLIATALARAPRHRLDTTPP